MSENGKGDPHAVFQNFSIDQKRDLSKVIFQYGKYGYSPRAPPTKADADQAKTCGISRKKSDDPVQAGCCGGIFCPHTAVFSSSHICFKRRMIYVFLSCCFGYAQESRAAFYIG